MLNGTVFARLGVSQPFGHLFLPLPSNKTVAGSFPADRAHRKQPGLCPPCWGEG